MGALAGIAFLSPLWLFGLAALPILWWLLRVTPPAPRRALFPAIRLLLQLQPKEETPAKTPLWLLLLRLLIAALIILALAHPLLNPGAQIASTGPVLVVVDDGWGSARNWPARKTMLTDIIDRADRNRQPVVLLSTAPLVTGEPPRPAASACRGWRARRMSSTCRTGCVTSISPACWNACSATAESICSPKATIAWRGFCSRPLPRPAA